MQRRNRPSFDGSLDELIPPPSPSANGSMHATTPPADQASAHAGMHAPMPAVEHETDPPATPTTTPSPVLAPEHAPEPPTMGAGDLPSTDATTPATATPTRQPRMAARGHGRKHAGEVASMHAPMQPSENGAAVISAVRRGHPERQLAFRVSPDEYKRLDRVAFEISDAFDGKVSKQDVVRLGLQMVLTDHEANGEASLLTRLAERKLRDL
jgi:hypothetical protein